METLDSFIKKKEEAYVKEDTMACKAQDKKVIKVRQLTRDVSWGDLREEYEGPGTTSEENNSQLGQEFIYFKDS